MTRTIAATRLAAGTSALADINGCLLWARSTNSRGYGLVCFAGTSHLAHRVAWETQVGPIPDGMTIDHLCKQKLCLNVAHLEVVSRPENSRRGNQGTKCIPRCERGHGRVGGNSASVAPDCTVCAKQGYRVAEQAVA